MVKKLIVIGFLVFAGIYSEAFGDAVLQDAFRKVSIDGIGVITIEYKSVNIIADKWSDVFSEDWKQQFLTPGKTDVLITNDGTTIKAVMTNKIKTDILWTKIVTMTDKDIIIDQVIRIEYGVLDVRTILEPIYLSNDILEDSTYEVETVEGVKKSGRLSSLSLENRIFVDKIKYLKVNSPLTEILFQFEGEEGDSWHLKDFLDIPSTPSLVRFGFVGKYDNKTAYERHLRIIMSFGSPK
ncbi:MAG: hypothetical protein AABY84_10745 [Candidatus Firestonebacteria bacterium]